MSQFHNNFIATVIDRYGLELDGRPADTIIATWVQIYDRTWIVKAIVESLYRGRYKIKSIDNILRDWQRLGKPLYNFTPEYEREILQNLPELTDSPATQLIEPIADIDPEPAASGEPTVIAIQPIVHTLVNSKDLDPEESPPFQHHQYSIATVPTQPQPNALPSIGTDNLANSSLPLNLHATPPAANLANNLPPLSSELVRRRGEPHRSRRSHNSTERIISPPVKLQLFKKLKAIVEPKRQQREEVHNSSLLCPLLSAENGNYARIAQFKLPIDNMSEEQQL